MKKIRKETNAADLKAEKETKDAEKNANNYEQDENTNEASDVYQTPVDFTNADYSKHADDDEEDNIYANDVLNFGCNSTSTPPVFKEPPPLPPKPKNIAWRFSMNNLSYNVHNNNSLESGHKSIYFDQPTSSFV